MSRSIVLKVDGKLYDHWTSASVTRDLNDFAGSFQFELRDDQRSLATFDFASVADGPFGFRPGLKAECLVDGQTVLSGFIENVHPQIDERSCSVSISGKDKAGDLADCTAAPKGPAEYKNVKLEDACKRIAEPFGVKVRSEIDTGEPFPRYGLDLSETGLSAIEKGARQRHALVMSDGTGGVVLTRTGAQKAPGDLTLPGNVKSSSGSFSHKGRYSKTTVRGQAEAAATARDGRAAPLSAGGSPSAPENRQASDGSATERERRGVTAEGEAEDDEITRYRPIVHLARSKAAEADCKDEADWRMRTARGNSEEVSYSVHGYGVAGKLWTVNQMVAVSDAFQMVERDMLISKVTYAESDAGKITDITVTSPEAFDKGPVKGRRTNRKKASKAARKTARGGSGGSGNLDTTAAEL